MTLFIALKTGNVREGKPIHNNSEILETKPGSFRKYDSFF